jgi:hypothetical protein
VVSAGVMTKSYTLTGLTTGVTYKIRVESRNSIGFSNNSNEITALAAIVPTAPAAPTTSIQINSVVI